MTTERAPESQKDAKRTRWAAWLVFVGLFLVYQANLSNLDEGDAVPSTNLPVALLAHGSFSFDPDYFPEMFKWRSLPPFYEQDDFFFTSWDDVFGERTTAAWRRDGTLVFNGPRYYVVESPKRHVYVSTFGPVPGVMVLPFFAPFYALDHAVHTKMALRASIAKLGSGSMVALTAAMILLAARRFAGLRYSVLLALVYGLGTCAFAVSSQNIWQQTVNQLFLTAGAFFFLGDRESKVRMLLAGFALGAATACRATGAVALILALGELFLRHRGRMPYFLLGTLPVPLAVAAYNFHYFGSPFTFAQEIMGHVIAEQKTGSPALWQTPLWLGAAGLLVSPSRGLLVFSPVLAPAFYGVYRVLDDDRYRAIRPFSAAALVLMTIQCKWFDWWGGHAYGYRPWLDAVPYLVLSMLPLEAVLLSTRFRQRVFGAAFAWSIFVQGLGALAYDRFWNLRQLFVVRVPDRAQALGLFTEEEAIRTADLRGGTYLGPTFCDIDLPYCRYRLWSVEDNMIGFLISHFGEARGRRLPMGFDELGERR